jgi:cell wall-associated NlpC family hydrolase
MRYLLAIALFWAWSAADTVDDAVNAILGIEPSVAARLRDALDDAVGAEADFGEQSQTVTDYLARGVINEVPPTRIAAGAAALWEALKQGAPAELASDIAEIGFSEAITAEQIVSSCVAVIKARRFGLDPAIVDELIYDGIADARPGAVIEASVLGLEKGVRSGIPQQKMAIALMVRFAQGTNGASMADIVNEEIAFITQRRTPAEIANERLAAALSDEGIDAAIVRELRAAALEEGWRDEQLRAALHGLRAAHRRNLTIEKVATALLIRIAQGYEMSSEEMVQEELRYVASLAPEKKKLETIEKDPALKSFLAGAKKRIKAAIRQGASAKTSEYLARAHPAGDAAAPASQTAAAPAAPESRPARDQSPSAETVAPPSLEQRIFDQSIQSFLTARAPRKPASTPYKWGGTTRRGVDCSGFTMVCYREQGIVIPRVSRVQFAAYKRKGRTVAKKDLVYGDLVFFSSNGHGRITHVGMFYKKNDKGENLFVHSSCTPGVNICNLDKNRYWAPRYVGAVRVVDTDS